MPTDLAHQGKQSGRVAHTVDINQVLVPPILSQRDSICESVLFSHPITSTRVLGTSDRFGERDIHDIVIQLADWYRGRDKVVGSWWVGKYDSLVGIRVIRGHLDESAC
jgi:hypothetical protein